MRVYDLVRSPGYVEVWTPGCPYEEMPDGCPFEDCEIAGAFTVRIKSGEQWWSCRTILSRGIVEDAAFRPLDLCRERAAETLYLELAA